MAWIRSGWVVVAAFGLLACKETVHSKNIRTGGIAMITTVTATSEKKSKVHTELLVGGDESNTYVILDPKDRLIADADGTQRTMSELDNEHGVYETSFNVGAEGTPFKVMLERDGDTDALDSSGKLPAPFDVTSDFGSDEQSRAKDLEITWDPSDTKNDMKVAFSDEGSDGCIFDDDEDIPGDTGTYVLPGGTLDSTGPKDDPKTCDVTGTLSRSTKGSTDSHLDGESKFTLKQVRTFTFTSAP